jgi:hypothetical protein
MPSHPQSLGCRELLFSFTHVVAGEGLAPVSNHVAFLKQRAVGRNVTEAPRSPLDEGLQGVSLADRDSPGTRAAPAALRLEVLP